MRILSAFRSGFAFFVLTLFFRAGTALAAPAGVPRSLADLFNVLCTVSNWFFGFVMVIAVMAFLYAAVLFFGSGGSSEKVGNAKKMLMYGGIGTAIGLLAKSLVFVIGSVLGIESGELTGWLC